MRRTPTEAEVAYAAGFFDGEGSITIERRALFGGKTINWRLRIVVAQNDQTPLLFLQSIWGGAIAERRRMNGNGVYYNWSLHTAQAGQFVLDVLPFSIVKRRELEIAAVFRERLAMRPPGRVPRTSPEEAAIRDKLKEDIRSRNRWSNSEYMRRRYEIG